MRFMPAILFSLVLAAPAVAAELSLVLDPAATKVSFVLEASGHDVNGLFGLDSARVLFDEETGEASGEIVLAAQSATTYKKKRDATMHHEVLASATHPRIVFIPKHFQGRLAEGVDSEVSLDGVVELLGVEHPLSLSATVREDAGRLHLKSVFTVPYIEWGLEDPSLLFLRVAKTVEVTVEGDGTLSPVGERAAR